MPLKIDTNQSATAFHIIDGAVLFPYAIDAQHAISAHPGEWSADPWPADATAAARKDAGEPDVEMTPEEQAAIDEHNKAVVEANERLKAFREKQAEDKKVADQVAADEALVASPPPRPDPTARRPFGRKGEMTPAEKAAAEKKAAGQKAADEKAAQDRQAAATGATITG